MILEESVKDLVVIGEDTSKKAKISGNKLAKLQYLLTKGLYKDPITAVIAEWTNNGIDAVVQANKNPIETPVIVKIEKNDKGQYLFSVEDKGTGLDERDFEDICMNYLESTKEGDNDTIGHFGIGMKSFLSLDRSATFTCRKNGVERKYLVYEGAEFVNYDLIYQKETTEDNGVIAELVINNWVERDSFLKKAKAKLAYYDTAVLMIDNVMVINDIHRNSIFQWSTLNSNTNMHLCLKDVYYPIDYEALGITPIPVPIAIRLSLGDGLTPTPSRESYITNEKTKEILLRKIREAADWLVNRYNETVREFDNFIKAYNYLGMTNFYVKFGDTDFFINSLLPYSSRKVLSPKVKGVSVRNPFDYKVRKASLLHDYNVVGYNNHLGIMKTSFNRIPKTKEYHILQEAGKVVLVADGFKGNIKDFLKEKHGVNVMFLRRNLLKRKLGTVKDKPINGQIKIDTESYRYVLDLITKPKSIWRDHIKEFDFVVSSIVATFVDETGVESTKEFQDWIDKKRELQRLNRKKGPSKAGLNKQVGDVTMAYSYKRYGKIFFKKEVFRIEKLHMNKFLTVLVMEDDNVDIVKNIVLGIEKQKNIRFALVGKKEIRKIPTHYQFINLKQFMSKDCKPFMRLASAIVFEKALEDLDEIKKFKNGIFQSILKSLAEDEKTLEVYVENNMTNLDNTTKGYIIDMATQNRLFDESIWDVYKRLEAGTKKYDFINLLQEPPTYNTETLKKYNTLVTQILLFRKKYYNDLPEGTKIVFEEEVAKI